MPKKNLTVQELRSFIVEQNLDGVADFLDFLKEEGNFQKFITFCTEKNIFEERIESRFDGIVFHGSQSSESTLKPSASIGMNGEVEDDSFVYATNDANYAIFLAVIQLNNASAGVTVTKEKVELIIDIDFVNGPSKFVTGFVHVLPAKTFKATENREYVSK